MDKFSLSHDVTSHHNPSSRLRLKDEIVALSSSMSTSHGKFSEQITELKLEHQEGLAKSDRLTELLVWHFAGWNSQYIFMMDGCCL